MSTVIGMRSQFNMLVSHSPPVFSHSPPNGFLSDYSTTNNRLYDPTRKLFRQSPALSSVQSKRTSYQTLRLINPTSPIRPCLVVKPEAESFDMTDASASHDHANKTKKKVVFADDQGHALTEIRIMSEPSNVPPLWSLEFLAHVTQGMVSPDPVEQWTVAFRQPASDYLDFRRKLDSQNVSLENVIVKENESMVLGTVKVRNLNFKKEVIVRTSCDDWKSQEDTTCTYYTVGGASGAYVLYDTFSFKLVLPPVDRKLEFCICFRSDGVEYWDNNDNKNYQIFKRLANYNTSSPLDIINKKQDYSKKENAPIPSAPISIQNKYVDLTQAKMSAGSDFSAWDHIPNGSPYW